MPVSFSSPPSSESKVAAVVTGASGFIGRRLMARLGASAHALPLAGTQWQSGIAAAPLAGAVVYHLGARVHRIGDADDAAFHRDNVEKTLQLARAALHAGARAVVFASTAKVLGEESRSPLAPDAPYAPQDAYARSKRAAEEALLDIRRDGLPVSIVRLPLVYGPGAAGNLARLRRLCDSAWPLPFAAVDNRRSWVHVDDVVELLVTCAQRPVHEPCIVHAAHPQPASTPQLVSAFRMALGRPARLFPCPVAWLEALAAAAGAGEAMRRLTRSLELDASATTARLAWRPRVDLARAVAEMARAPA